MATKQGLAIFSSVLAEFLASGGLADSACATDGDDAASTSVARAFVRGEEPELLLVCQAEMVEVEFASARVD